MQKSFYLVLMALVLSTGWIPHALAEKRVALVIGNSAYKHTQLLSNPKNDANAIAATLKKIGFQSVEVKNDLGVDGMRRALRDFGDQADGADTALVFFAGHGMELGGENYLVPIDAKLRKGRHLQFEAIKLSSVLQSVEGAKRLRLVMLDACRNNPFAASMRLSGNAKRNVARGFGRVEPEGDVLVAYASRHGTTADDGVDKHSPYTTALLNHLAEPGIDIRLMLGKVRDSVKSATAGEQVPHIYGTLGGGNVYLVPPDPGTGAAKMTALEQRLKELEAKLKEKSETKVSVGVFPKKAVPPSRSLKLGDEFRDCPDCPKMVVVPSGSFMMGSPANEKGRDNDEGPQHRVSIPRAFTVGKFEITFSEWNACVAGDGCNHEPDDQDWGRGQRPVINVSWDDAKTYVAWLSRLTGKTYRLLSEAEWEYAARAGAWQRFHFGNDESDLCGYANARDVTRRLNSDSCSDGVVQKTAKVGNYRPNTFGLHDMHGNVWEWVEDCWSNNYIKTHIDDAAFASGSCALRVLRGGSWNDKPAVLRLANRESIKSDFRYNAIGFRVARTLTPEELK